MNDVEELISGTKKYGSSPFSDDYVVPGYGAKEGFICLDHEEILGCECKGAGWKKWDESLSPGYFNEVLMALKTFFENDMGPTNLSVLGLYKDDDKKIRIKYSGSFLGLQDIEHMLCKVYKMVQRTRGNLSRGKPRASNNYCWPPIRKDTCGTIWFEKLVVTPILNAYENTFDDNLVSDVGIFEHPFKYI